MIEILIEEPFRASIDKEKIIIAVETVLDRQPRFSGANLTLVIGDNERIQALNREYMHVDAPTDVLSFPAGFEDPERGTAYLGDIIIGFPQAASQAEAAGHPVMDELQLLTVHGVLHLLGYDHASDDQKEAMWGEQAKVLDSLGVRARPHD